MVTIGNVRGVLDSSILDPEPGPDGPFISYSYYVTYDFVEDEDKEGNASGVEVIHHDSVLDEVCPAGPRMPDIQGESQPWPLPVPGPADPDKEVGQNVMLRPALFLAPLDNFHHVSCPNSASQANPEFSTQAEKCSLFRWPWFPPPPS